MQAVVEPVRSALHASTTRDQERSNDPRAALLIGDAVPKLGDPSHEFVTDHRAWLHPRGFPTEKMDIRAADSALFDLHDRVHGLLDAGTRDIFYLNATGSRVDNCSHRAASAWAIRCSARSM
jgi:hypothetical protein